MAKKERSMSINERGEGSRGRKEGKRRMKKQNEQKEKLRRRNIVVEGGVKSEVNGWTNVSFLNIYI
ncbi:unnamed protein product [Meloidogyne enterolobii]|uniref:Uncharacterized protein n=1 Tax=Meloidogyne enterolobii TaxID=390850 RepID=A0ACB0Z8B1_MELEN